MPTSALSPLRQDIDDIIRQPMTNFKTGFRYEVKLHTVDKDLDVSDGIVPVAFRIVRDYIGSCGDYIEVDLTCPFGTYLYDVYPYLNNIELSVYTERQYHPNGLPTVVTERYKAVYLIEKNQKLPTIAQGNKSDLNQRLPIALTLQLIDRSVETLRIKTLHGNFDRAINRSNKDMSPGGFLRSIISEHANKVLIENRPAIDRLEIEPPDNTEPLKSVTIGSNTRLVEVPEQVQTKNGGVYNGGIGNYIQRYSADGLSSSKVFSVYSLYNTTKYPSAVHKTLFYVPSTTPESILDRTYRHSDGVLKLLAHTATRIDDTKEAPLMSTGSGYRVSSAASYMKKPVELTPSGPKFKKTGLNTEIVGLERDDGLNFAPNKGITYNLHQLSSEVLAKQGKYISLMVSNLDPDFIIPGGKCKISYEDKHGQVAELYGVIHRVYIGIGQQVVNLSGQLAGEDIHLYTKVTFEVFVNEA